MAEVGFPTNCVPKPRLAGDKPTTGTPKPELIVTVAMALPVPEELVALTVTVEVPAAEGVPEIKPVFAFAESPLGKPVAE
jgi:hypothetical protein